jgi:4-hydroxy-tetrahydrodipicolinate synthase
LNHLAVACARIGQHGGSSALPVVDRARRIPDPVGVTTKKIEGVIPAIPTPLLPNEDVDVAGLERIIDHVIRAGAAGIFVLGNMGEGAALVDPQKRVAVSAAVRHARGRVPVLAGISDVSTRRTIESGKAIQDLGPDFLVSTTPYYYSFPHPDSIMGFFETLGRALSRPLVFYHAPGATGNKVGLETLDRLMNLPFIVAIKDSSGDFRQVVELLRRYPDRAARPAGILQGDEFVYDISLLMGADGVITGGGTAFVPELVALYDACRAGDRARAFALQRDFRAKMDEMLGPELLVDWMHAIKERLAADGLCGDTVTHPFLARKRQR